MSDMLLGYAMSDMLLGHALSCDACATRCPVLTSAMPYQARVRRAPGAYEHLSSHDTLWQYRAWHSKRVGRWRSSLA
eukprot:2045360-Rhodomonas_salina.1